MKASPSFARVAHNYLASRDEGPTIALPGTNRHVSTTIFLAHAFNSLDRLDARLERLEGLSGRDLRQARRWALEEVERVEAYKARWKQWERTNPVSAAQVFGSLPREFRETVEKLRA